MLKKLLFIIAISFSMVMCNSSKNAAEKGKADKASVEVRYRDDFRAATQSERNSVLAELNAEGTGTSVLILTQNYKGEKITVSNKDKQLFSNYSISDLKTGIADTMRIDNTKDTTVYDSLSKKQVTIPATEAAKYKFIYLMKNPGGENEFILTYSNTLRPLGYDL